MKADAGARKRTNDLADGQWEEGTPLLNLEWSSDQFVHRASSQPHRTWDDEETTSEFFEKLMHATPAAWGRRERERSKRKVRIEEGTWEPN